MYLPTEIWQFQLYEPPFPLCLSRAWWCGHVSKVTWSVSFGFVALHAYKIANISIHIHACSTLTPSLTLPKGLHNHTTQKPDSLETVLFFFNQKITLVSLKVFKSDSNSEWGDMIATTKITFETTLFLITYCLTLRVTLILQLRFFCFVKSFHIFLML